LITYNVEGVIATVLLDRPEQRNALSREFWDELRQTLRHAEADSSVRVLIIRGAGQCFSVGGDVAAFKASDDPAQQRAFVADAVDALHSLERFPKPTITAVHGEAVGGGCELTLASDIVIADETAGFGMPEAQIGLLPALAVVRGQSQLNLHWMKYMIFTGAVLSADDARLAGLVNFVVPPGMHVEEAERIAVRIASRAPLALAVGKQILGRDIDDGYSHGVDALAFLQSTDDHAEGIAAFQSHRDPRFEGR
jgi:enoyl-CoA hydratase/carnithine racemase